MRNNTNPRLAGWILLVAATVFTTDLPAAETSVARQEWHFPSSASPVGPDTASNVSTPAQTTIAPGEFGSGWLSQIPLGDARGVWDLGRRGTITIVCPPASQPPGSRQIRVRVAQWMDGTIFTEYADVAIPGATRTASIARHLNSAVFGAWVEDVSVWDAAAGADTGRIVITGSGKGSVVDRVIVETEAVALAPVALSIRTLATGNGIELSWPSDVEGYTLEQADSLKDPISWNPTDPPQLSGDRFVIEVEAGVSTRFFRLRKQQ